MENDRFFIKKYVTRACERKMMRHWLWQCRGAKRGAALAKLGGGSEVPNEKRVPFWHFSHLALCSLRSRS